MSGRSLRVVVVCLIAIVAVFGVDAGLFRSGLYRRFLDPNSTAGAFEWRIGEVAARARDPRHDVLVLGDSRTLEALAAPLASQSAQRLRFINAAVPGTDPRCWYYFLRGADPNRGRFAAIVVPLDTYNDDDGSLGAGDAADHAPDINYVVFQLRPGDVADFARSFDYAPARRAAYEAGILHAFALKRDVQAFVSDPRARLRTIATYGRTRHETSDDYAGQRGSLQGLAVDRNGQVTGLGAVPETERDPFLARLEHAPLPSPAYAAYRRVWLGRILERYRSTPTRIVFVRIPALPLVIHRRPEDQPSAVRALAARYHAVLLPATTFWSLEQPRYFADHDHLNVEGRRIFSTEFGALVAANL